MKLQTVALPIFVKGTNRVRERGTYISRRGKEIISGCFRFLLRVCVCVSRTAALFEENPSITCD